MQKFVTVKFFLQVFYMRFFELEVQTAQSPKEESIIYLLKSVSPPSSPAGFSRDTAPLSSGQAAFSPGRHGVSRRGKERGPS